MSKANEIIRTKVEVIGMKTGLKQLTLTSLILRDAIVRTARKTTEWATHYNDRARMSHA